ncbi:FAD-binding protein [Thermodesulfobacteriota bacterium]
MLTSLEKRRVQTEVLCIGGGPAGLMAAIRAADLGVNVLVADKGNTVCSGSASGGNDHYRCYIPEVHGNDTGPIIKEAQHAPLASGREEFTQVWLDMSFEIVKLWDSWGIPMKYNGKWEFAGHSFPGRPRIYMHYSGGNQKQVLTEQALKRGVKIMNRVTVFELLKDGERVTGALGLDTWNGQVIEFQAKSVFMSTGGCSRLYPSSTPGWMFNIPFCPVLTGDGRAMVYRAGGELADIEFTGQWAGVKYFSRSGKATWTGVLRGPDDQPIGPFVTKPDKIFGDITSDIWPTVFDDYMRSGKGPVYMSFKGATDEDIGYIRHWLMNEGNKGMLDHMAEEGIDLKKHALEFRTYEIGVKGGVWFNINAETSLKGLYAAGDEYFGSMANSTIWGWIGGERAARFSKEADFAGSGGQKALIDKKTAVFESMLSRRDGATWKEANIALQQIMAEYAGMVRSETLIEQGMRNLRRLKEKSLSTLMAGNGHELGRCLEVLNLLDVGELVMHAVGERKETRGKHTRADHPFTNPLLDKLLIIKKDGDKPVFQWRQKGGA